MLKVMNNNQVKQLITNTDLKTTKYANFTYNSAFNMAGVAYVYNGPMNVIGFIGQTTSKIASGSTLFNLPWTVTVQQFGGLHGSDGNKYGIQIVNNSVTTYNEIPAGITFRDQIVFFTYL